MNKIQTELYVFLKKVKDLRGYGDMDSYKYVKKLEDLVHKNEYELEKIIEGFSTLETYNLAKSALIKQIEKEIEDNYTKDSDCI